ncbi:Ig-like domain-containing protein [Flavobacterium sp. NRK1]|jgi:hypothetical protein|uniref:Ig-like domain-containing protein n=1 Tax=Flavobacterium sp. NRK1 TaxID=2954929 RepID=UPI0020929771|nr:Ig-like domain-containing protein [Flavobacterium sp. NRK1]MCO6148861.1 Ig-like domain-containing protein [Flavobacterium sp. NRK1]
MATTRQIGSAKGTFRFSPANPTIEASDLSTNGEFKFTVTINIKDHSGQPAAGEKVKFSVPTLPSWLSMPDVLGITNANGNVTLTVRGRVTGDSENGYVNFTLVNSNTPERNGSGMIAFTGKPASGMKRLFLF